MQQLHRRTPRHLHPVSPHLSNHVLKQLPKPEVPVRPYHHSHSPVYIQEAASAPSTTSPHHVIPPVPNSHFTPGLGLPSFPFVHPDLSAMPAPWASVLHICDPWFAMGHRRCDLCCCSAKAASRPSSNTWSLPYLHLPSKQCSCRQCGGTPTWGILEKV